MDGVDERERGTLGLPIVCSEVDCIWKYRQQYNAARILTRCCVPIRLLSLLLARQKTETRHLFLDVTTASATKSRASQAKTRATAMYFNGNTCFSAVQLTLQNRLKFRNRNQRERDDDDHDMVHTVVLEYNVPDSPSLYLALASYFHHKHSFVQISKKNVSHLILQAIDASSMRRDARTKPLR
jgi:hypothetical protein